MGTGPLDQGGLCQFWVEGVGSSRRVWKYVLSKPWGENSISY
jgi:hypothetical protein